MAKVSDDTKKPVLVNVIGIISIVFCLATGIFLVSNIISNASNMRRNVEPPGRQEAGSAGALYAGIVKASEEYGRLLGILDFIKTAIAAVGLAGGILLLLSKRTGEIFIISYAFTGMAVLAISIVFIVFFAVEEQTVIRDFFQAEGFAGGDLAANTARMTDFGTYVWMVLLTNLEVIWPIMVFILMSRKKVKAYFRRPGVTVGE